VKFRPAKTTPVSNHKLNHFAPNSQIRTHRHSGQQQGGMGPPPTPSRQNQLVNTAIHVNHANSNPASISESIPVGTHPRTSRFVPPEQPSTFRPYPVSQPSLQIGNPQALPSARVPSRAGPINTLGGNHRIPFVPGARGGLK